MITLRNVSSLRKKGFNLEIPSLETLEIDASNLFVMPGLIDPHVHFRTPGAEHKENWVTAAKAALKGGFTTVFDMPNTNPATVTQERLKDKKALIDSQIKESGIPLRYHLYFGADKKHFDEIAKVKQDVVALKIFMGTSTGDLLMDDDASLHAAFALAAAHDLLVCVHAEDEAMIVENQAKQSSRDFKTHSLIRTPLVAKRAVLQAISLSRMYQTRLHILHVSTKDEIDAIANAKKEGLNVTCEVTPHHLFLSIKDYDHLQGKAQVNPPLRSEEHQSFLFKAIKEGIIDTIGSDHAPHTRAEKAKPYPNAPSGMPGLETTLPLLLSACREGLLELEDIQKLCLTNIQKIYRIGANDDLILVDLEKTKTIQDDELQTKCAWSPYSGKTLKGFPVYAIIDGKLFNLKEKVVC